MSNKKGHPKATFLASQTRGFPIGLNNVRVFVQSFCAVIVQTLTTTPKRPYLVEPSGIEPLTSTLPVSTAQKPNALISMPIRPLEQKPRFRGISYDFARNKGSMPPCNGGLIND